MKYYRVDGIGDLDADHPTPYDYLFNIWLESWIKEPGSDYWYAEDYFTVNVFQFVLLWLLGKIQGTHLYEIDQIKKSHYRSHCEWVQDVYFPNRANRLPTREEMVGLLEDQKLTLDSIEDLLPF